MSNVRTTLAALLIAFSILNTGCEIPVSTLTGEAPKPKAEVVDVEPDQLPLPAVDSDAAWDVGYLLSSPPSRPIHLEKILPNKHRIWGAAVSHDSGRALLTYVDKTDRDSKKTSAIVCNVNHGRVLARWKVDEYLAPFSISPNGKRAILCRKDGVLSARETLYLATWLGGTNIPHMEIWRPLVPKDADQIKQYVKDWEINWASFVGNDRIVTLNNAGKLHVWNARSLERLAVFPGVVGTPTVTPDGSKVAFLTEDMVALLDPRLPEITRVRRVGELPERPLVTIRPNGRLIAIAGKGQMILMDTQTMKQSHAMVDTLSTGKSMDLMPDLAWAGNFIYKSRQLYDLDSPIPVWRITGTRYELPVGDRLWAIVNGKGKNSSGIREVVFRSFKLPATEINSQVQEIYRTTDVIALRVGDPVRIDVTTIPFEKREEIKSVLTQRLREEGYRVSNSAKVTMKASLDKKIESDVTYSLMWSGKEKWKYSYTIQRARLEFIKDGRSLWSTTGSHSPPGSIREDKLPSKGHVAEWGKPDYSIYSEHRLPTYLRGDRSGSTLGDTYLFAAGMK